MWNSKSNHFINYFHENKFNLFKTWEGIREIVNIYRKGKIDITSTQIAKKLSANEINKHLTSISKQKDEKLVIPKHKYYKHLTNTNTNFSFKSPTSSHNMLKCYR